jgi:hypothetical protein
MTTKENLEIRVDGERLKDRLLGLWWPGVGAEGRMVR